jgi:hypothetical protein
MGLKNKMNKKIKTKGFIIQNNQKSFVNKLFESNKKLFSFLNKNKNKKKVNK